MANNFCRHLGSQYRFDLTGISPCCYYKERFTINSKEEFDNLDLNLRSKDKWTSGCVHCLQKERKGIESPRQASLKFPENYGLNTKEDVYEITSIEIQTNRDCNGACLMCSSEFSTTWQKYESKYNKSIIVNNYQEEESLKKLEYVKKFINFSKLKKIGFTNGGEPLKNNTHILFLKELQKIGNLENVTVSYVSNGSIKPSQELVDLWKEAKRVEINISIDGVNEHFNYLRWPLQFNQVVDNIDYILSLDLAGQFSTSYCLTPLNIFYHDRYVEWGKDFIKNYKNSRLRIVPFFNFPTTAFGIMCIDSLPNDLRLKIFEKYGENHVISKLTIPFNEFYYQKFINYVKFHDSQRNLNFRKIFPEVENYFYDIPN
jgi:MoaA/NifB/PqqE/SkfB family radical SAM enzyme